VRGSYVGNSLQDVARATAEEAGGGGAEAEEEAEAEAEAEDARLETDAADKTKSKGERKAARVALRHRKARMLEVITIRVISAMIAFTVSMVFVGSSTNGAPSKGVSNLVASLGLLFLMLVIIMVRERAVGESR
jgi:hypothetical protein